MAEIKFRVPENLVSGIDRIIDENKELFGQNKLSKDKLLYLCDAVLKSRAYKSKELENKENPYAPLSSAILKDVMHDYVKHIKFLLTNGILLSDNHFIEREKCIGYCFNAPYAGKRSKVVTIDNLILKNAINRVTAQHTKEVKKSVWGYSYLTKWWHTGLLKIDKAAAGNWIDNYEIEKKDSIKNDSKRDKKVRLKRATETSDDFKYLVGKIDSKKPRYSFSGLGHRFYNPLSNLKKELRGYLTYDGKPLVEVDMKSSQPFLLPCLFKSSFWESLPEKSLEKLCLGGVSKELYEIGKNKKEYKDIITFLKSLETLYPKDSPFKKYVDLVVNKEFYEYIQEHLGPLYPTRFNCRPNVKIGILTIFYLDNIRSAHNPPSETFKTHFPEVYELIRLVKKIQPNYLALILQRIESFLIINKVCKEISKKYPHIPLFTIHDSIITTKGNESIVEATMSAEIAKWVGNKPQLEVKNLEVWKPVLGYKGYYEISSSGYVRSLDRKVPYPNGYRTVKARTIKARVNNRGYLAVRLSKDGVTSTKFVHILSAEAFVSNPDNKPYVNHQDGNKLNNYYTNFSWVSHSENIQHAYDTGLIKINSKAVVNECTSETFSSIKEAAKAININYGTCRNYLNGKIKTNKTCLKLAS